MIVFIKNNIAPSRKNRDDRKIFQSRPPSSPANRVGLGILPVGYDRFAVFSLIFDGPDEALSGSGIFRFFNDRVFIVRVPKSKKNRDFTMNPAYIIMRPALYITTTDITVRQWVFFIRILPDNGGGEK